MCERRREGEGSERGGNEDNEGKEEKQGGIHRVEQRKTQDVNELKISVRVNLKNLAQQR